MEEITQLQNQLREYGFDDYKLNMLMALAFDEFMEQFETDLSELEIEDLEGIEAQMSGLTINDLMNEDSKLQSILEKVYGLQAKSKANSFVKEYLADAIEQAKVAKDFLEKTKSGDPTLLSQGENDPNKDVIEKALKIATEE